MPPRAPVPTTVTAVIPHWNRRDLLATLLDNLAAQTRKFDEIVVVDNGSSDGSAEHAEKLGLRVIRLDRNLGFAAAVNRGIGAARSEWVAILNNDVTLAPDWLETLSAAVSPGGVAFACGKILSAGNPTILDGTFDALSRAACAARCGSGKQDAPIWNQTREVLFAPMTAALFRADLFDSVGPLDELFGSYLEDVDFGLRCALAGFRGRYVPTAIAYHEGSATFGKWSAESVWRISRNQVLLAAKHFRRQPRAPIAVGQALWGLVALRHACGLAFLRGKMQGWNDMRKVQSQPSGEQEVKELAAILEASEKQIQELGRATGFDPFWRAYFWLSPR